MRANKTLKYFSEFTEKIPDLTPREREVIFRRLKSKTLVKIGKKFKVTESRIRQIESSAINKLKSRWHQQRLFPH